MEYIVELHSKYKPIVWAPFPDVEKNIQKQEWYFNVNFLTSKLKNFTITHETSNVINDGHFGQYGNYYMAVLFDEIIKPNQELNKHIRRNKFVNIKIYNNGTKYPPRHLKR